MRSLTSPTRDKGRNLAAAFVASAFTYLGKNKSEEHEFLWENVKWLTGQDSEGHKTYEPAYSFRAVYEGIRDKAAASFPIGQRRMVCRGYTFELNSLRLPGMPSSGRWKITESFYPDDSNALVSCTATGRLFRAAEIADIPLKNVGTFVGILQDKQSISDGYIEDKDAAISEMQPSAKSGSSWMAVPNHILDYLRSLRKVQPTLSTVNLLDNIGHECADVRKMNCTASVWKPGLQKSELNKLLRKEYKRLLEPFKNIKHSKRQTLNDVMLEDFDRQCVTPQSRLSQCRTLVDGHILREVNNGWPAGAQPLNELLASELSA